MAGDGAAALARRRAGGGGGGRRRSLWQPAGRRPALDIAGWVARQAEQWAQIQATTEMLRTLPLPLDPAFGKFENPKLGYDPNYVLPSVAEILAAAAPVSFSTAFLPNETDLAAAVRSLVSTGGPGNAASIVRTAEDGATVPLSQCESDRNAGILENEADGCAQVSDQDGSTPTQSYNSDSSDPGGSKSSDSLPEDESAGLNVNRSYPAQVPALTREEVIALHDAAMKQPFQWRDQIQNGGR
jgi:hypothetical protein